MRNCDSRRTLENLRHVTSSNEITFSLINSTLASRADVSLPFCGDRTRTWNIRNDTKYDNFVFVKCGEKNLSLNKETC